MHYANQGEFVRGKSANQITPYCVSIYEANAKFDELPCPGEAPFWCKTQEEALKFVSGHMKDKPDQFTYVIRKLEVTHV